MAKQANAPPPPVLPIPDADSVARFCGVGVIDTDGQVTGAAFQPRMIDEGRLSTEWLQCLSSGTDADRLNAARNALGKHVAGYDANGKVVVFSVERVRQLVIETRPLDVIHRPSPKHKCHATITGLEGLQALAFAELLADLARDNTHPARLTP